MKLPKLVKSKPAVKKADPGDGKVSKPALKPTGSTSQSGFDTSKRPGPKRNISKEIRNHKRAFDYLIIVTESGPCFVVDGEVKAEKAAKMYLNFRPEADAVGSYEESRARFNVTTQAYELVTDPEAKTQGTFPVHIFHMEE